VLIRLRAHNRQAVVYATPETGASYKAIADRMVDQEPFIALLTSAEEPKAVETAATRVSPTVTPTIETPAADRNEIEALARKVHAATNVPLFSPKSYLELFRALAEEIARNGYHFQATAENVAAKLTASGRNATRRQIVFIVKGLALKGHVFSNTDTPERLADVFREQVIYLIRNAGLELTAREQAILPAWIIGRAGSASSVAEIEPEKAAPAPLPKPKEEPVQKVATEKPLPKPEDQAKAAKKKPGKPPVPFNKGELAPLPPRPAVFTPKPTETPKPVDSAPKAAEVPKPATPARVTIPPRPNPLSPLKPAAITPKPLSGTAPLAPKPAPALPGVSPTRVPLPQAKTIARPIAEKPPAEKTPPEPPAPVEEKPVAEKAPAEKGTPVPGGNTVESSILAAIAQAVDVLVEDSSDAKASAGNDDLRQTDNPAPAANELPPPDSDDIGDEIQRIIATYNRDRQQS
jgi:hypothetical protein